MDWITEHSQKTGIIPCLFCTNSDEQSLNRKEFVAIRLWRNLNWKFLIIVLSVDNLGSK